MARATEQMVGLSVPPFKPIAIWSLSDDLLSKIFTYLNANDRFRLAKVCFRWADVSRMDWTDISSLDLSAIPNENIGSIIQLCPKLESISALDGELNVMAITENLRSELKSLHLYRVSAHTGLPLSLEDNLTFGDLPNEFLRQLQQLTHLKELVLSELPLASLLGSWHFVWDNMPGSLKHLQLDAGVFLCQHRWQDGFAIPIGSIDCLILQEDLLLSHLAMTTQEVVIDTIARMAAILLRMHPLRELSLGPLLSDGFVAAFSNYLVRRLDRLELFSIQLNDAEAISGLLPFLNCHPSLRILIITGEFAEDEGEILIPPRRRYPNGLGSAPLPLLHVFVGGQIAQKIRFARASNDALEIHPINLPMPAFLEQPAMAAIFKGSWIGAMIKKGAKANSRLWDYDARIAQSVLVLNA